MIIVRVGIAVVEVLPPRMVNFHVTFVGVENAVVEVLPTQRVYVFVEALPL